MSRRESVKFNLKYVLSALHELGVDDEDDTAEESRKPSIVSVVDLQPVMATLRAIGEVNDKTMKEVLPPAYNLEYILATLAALAEKDPEDEELTYTLSSALTDKQLNAKHEIENIVTSLTAIEKKIPEHDHQMTHAESKAAEHSNPKGFDLQFVLLSLEALGEDEGETETFLQSLDPARKNTLVRCNLQYVLSSLDQLEGSRDVFDEYKSGPQSPPLSRHFPREHSDHEENIGTRNSYQSHSMDDCVDRHSPHKDFQYQKNQIRFESKDGEYQKSASVDEYRSNAYRK